MSLALALSPLPSPLSPLSSLLSPLSLLSLSSSSPRKATRRGTVPTRASWREAQRRARASSVSVSSSCLTCLSLETYETALSPDPVEHSQLDSPRQYARNTLRFLRLPYWALVLPLSCCVAREGADGRAPHSLQVAAAEVTLRFLRLPYWALVLPLSCCVAREGADGRAPHSLQVAAAEAEDAPRRCRRQEAHWDV